ncbi:hypothetical protein [Mucilaginibacter humi]|uniref:hypothetical protein n=1 Tax=Mucilaginibacter humi TaxID=2732510 RepID=UPI001C2E60BF|nr:hypothetical protein [Mucilaginibacter humi]
MQKLKYERPFIKKLNAGLMNKFGTRTETQPVKDIDGVPVKTGGPIRIAVVCVVRETDPP